MWRLGASVLASSGAARAVVRAAPREHSGKRTGALLAASAAIAAATIAGQTSVAHAEGAAEQGRWEWQSLKAKWVGNYENRIRAFSHPLKVFQYFSSATDKHGEKAMTPMDFIISLVTYQAGTI